jgi:hypothetical protein
MNRSSFKRATYATARTVHKPIPPEQRRNASMVALSGAFCAPIANLKTKTLGRGAAEGQHKARLVLMGCMVCRRVFGPHDPGPVELHHLRSGGWGKGNWMTLIPLCPEHHRGPSGVHGLGTKGFAKHYGFNQADLLADVHQSTKGNSYEAN